MSRLARLSIVALALGVASLFLEQAEITNRLVLLLIGIVDYSVLGLTLLEVGVEIVRAPVRRNYLRRNLASLLFVAAFVTLFVYNRTISVDEGSRYGYLTVLIIRNIFLLLKVFTRLRHLSEFFSSVISHPAQTIVLSFVLVIVVGTLILMMPFTTVDGLGLPFVDALFTATSAVCVTGLIVVDTATAFTVWGQAIIVALIQIGGLGIMILSFFTVFVFRQRVSVENKLLISYLLSENNMRTLTAALRRIIVITLAIEAAGALSLYPGLARVTDSTGLAVFYSVFHSISAFCNAGFALFSDSLEQFAGAPGVLIPVSLLVTAGGLSFAVITNGVSVVSGWSRSLLGRRQRKTSLSVTSRAVILVSLVLTGAGILLFYAFEFGRSMAHLPLGTQYLTAFFQSVTLRTAGFNSVPLGNLATATYLFMMTWMFVGGASGSTAGGIKVNTVAVIGAYLSSLRRGRRETVLFSHTVREPQVATAFTVLLFGVIVVIVSTVVLAITETFSLTEILFESVSAFGTVGLSTGITGSLSMVGRFVIIGLMFIGRVGPLTLFSAISGAPERIRVSYPRADILVG